MLPSSHRLGRRHQITVFASTVAASSHWSWPDGLERRIDQMLGIKAYQYFFISVSKLSPGRDPFQSSDITWVFFWVKVPCSFLLFKALPWSLVCPGVLSGLSLHLEYLYRKYKAKDKSLTILNGCYIWSTLLTKMERVKSNWWCDLNKEAQTHFWFYLGRSKIVSGQI